MKATHAIHIRRVVFFGESIAAPVVQESYARIDQASALLVIGSSLTVFSAYRLVRRAHERRIPIAVLSLGETRADSLIDFKVLSRASDMMGRLMRML